MAKHGTFFTHESHLHSDVFNDLVSKGLDVYGFCMVFFETLSTIEGHRIGKGSTELNGLAERCGISADEAVAYLESMTDTLAVQTDGLGFWSDYLESKLDLFKKRSESGRKAAHARWGGSIVKKEKRVVDLPDIEIEEDLVAINVELSDSAPEAVSSPTFEVDDLDISMPDLSETNAVKRKDGKFDKLKMFYEETFNSVRSESLAKLGKHSRTISININKKALSRLKNYMSLGVTEDDLVTLIESAFKDEHHIKNAFKYITFDFLLRDEIFQRYTTIADGKKVQKETKPRGNTFIER